MNSDRVRNQKHLAQIINGRLGEATAHYWLELFESRGVPCGPSVPLPEVLESEQTKVSRTHLRYARSQLNQFEVYQSIRQPLTINESPVIPRDAPPRLGEHSEKILKQFGIGENEIDELIGKKIVSKMILVICCSKLQG